MCGRIPAGAKFFTLKFLALVTTFLAALLIGLDRQTSTFGAFVVEATYKSSNSFKFFLGGNAVVAGYCLLTLPFTCLNDKFVVEFVMDLLMTCLATASAAAATGVAEIAKNGNAQIGWPQVCQYYNTFCDKAGVAIAFSYVGCVFMIILCIFSFTFQRARIEY